jgi:hypothetical protein
MQHSKLPVVPQERPIYTMSLARMPAWVSKLREFTPAVCLLAVASAMLAVPPAMCAQRLPPTPPTSVSSPSSVAAPIAATTPAANMEPHHRARVNYTGGMLEVRADNSSLNQILRDISRQTGMKIVGGVADQRVFGVYGPAPAATVLQTLLDGTGTNVLLKETADHAPEELMLSPQVGGISPPPPGSAAYDATESEPELALPGAAQPSSAVNPAGTRPASGGAESPAPSTSPTMPQPANNVLGNPNNVSPTASTVPVTNSVPVNSLPTPSTAPPVNGIVDAPNPPPAGSTTAGFTSQTPPNSNPNNAPPATTPPAANGVKTPQQIYQELLQMQQKGNQKGNPQGSSAPQ